MNAKRIFDVVCVLIGLSVVWPFILLIAVIIRVCDGSPILFRQKRVGRGGRPFVMLKFRTMRQVEGAKITIGADARITALGVFLRKLKLDELPQLWNVLCGEMSLVGPRPEIEEYVRLYSSDQRRVLELTPGITDPASLKYYAESEMLAQAKDPQQFYIEAIMPDKIRMNLEYAQGSSVWRDLGLIIKTVARTGRA